MKPADAAPTARKPNHVLWAILFVVGTLIGGALLAILGTKGEWVRKAIEERQGHESVGQLDGLAQGPFPREHLASDVASI